MTPSKDGGPAFPRSPAPTRLGDRIDPGSPGISARDYFAAHTMMGLLADPNYASSSISEEVTAQKSYALVKAMVRIREGMARGQRDHKQEKWAMYKHRMGTIGFQEEMETDAGPLAIIPLSVGQALGIPTQERRRVCWDERIEIEVATHSDGRLDWVEIRIKDGASPVTVFQRFAEADTLGYRTRVFRPGRWTGYLKALQGPAQEAGEEKLMPRYGPIDDAHIFEDVVLKE